MGKSIAIISGYSDLTSLNKVAKSFSESIKSWKLIERDYVVLKLENAEYSYPLLFAL